MKYIEFFAKYRKKVIVGLLILGILLKIFVFRTPTFSLIHDTCGIIAFFITFLGVILRSWAAGVINKGKALTCNGPFHLCRNPQYLGSLMIGVGLTLVLNSIYLWFFLLILPIIYFPKIKAEETYLSAIFKDEFQKYKRLTGMFYPKRISFEMFLCNWSSKQWKKNKEYTTWILAIVGAIVLEAVKTFTG